MQVYREEWIRGKALVNGRYGTRYGTIAEELTSFINTVYQVLVHRDGVDP